MKLCILESPFQGGIARNKAYLQKCIRYCLRKGYAPFASHQMYTSALDDHVPQERELGIAAGFAWADSCATVFFFEDLGWSRGMKNALERYEKQGTKTIIKVKINT